MSINKLSIIVVFLFCILSFVASAQEIVLPEGIAEEQIRAEIVKRGLNEEEVREALSIAGFDMDDLSSIQPEQLPELQRIIDDLVASKNDNKTINVIVEDNSEESTDTKEVEKEVEELKDDVKELVKEEVIFKASEVFGHRMFRNKEIKFYSNNDGIRAPDYYVLGSGDELAISIFGNSYKEANYTINNAGYIQILNGQKKVSLKGLTLVEARKKLKRIFNSYYKFQDGEFNISLNYSRPVTISVYGEVANPGAITLPAINNVFNALAAVGGPNEIGSIRSIQVVKKDGSRVELDLFDYIKNPSSNKSFFLSDNDMIIVPAVNLVVEVAGAINRSMLYELKKGEGLKTLVDFAGGFTKNAYTKSLKVSRIQNNERIFIDIDFTNQNHFVLQHGDEVLVKEISTNLTNYVMINGEVVSEGQYERKKGMRILDLVNKAGLKKETRLDLIYLKRIANDNTILYTPINLEEIVNNPRSTSNLLLEDKDQLTLWSKGLFLESGSISVKGAIRMPKEIEVNGNKALTVGNAILLSGGLSLDASTLGMVYRQDPLQENKIQYINLNFENGEDSEDYSMTLKSKDILKIYSKNVFKEKSEISIFGAVNNPGVFQYGHNMTLKQAMLLAEGTKISAAKNRIEISRTILKDNEPTKTVIANLSIDNGFNVKGNSEEFVLMPYDNIYVRDVPDFELQQTIRLTGEVKFPGEYAIISNNETILDVVERAGGITEEGFTEGASLYRPKDDLGFLIIQLDEVLKDKKNKFNFKLRGGDEINIPKINDFVAIQGATKVRLSLDEKLIDKNNQIHVPFQKGKKLRYYINEYAGGFDKGADLSKVSVMYPNGGVKSSKNYLFFRTYPKIKTGSIISIGYKKKKIKKDKGEKNSVDWDKIVNNTISQATTLLTLLAVTKSLSN